MSGPRQLLPLEHDVEARLGGSPCVVMLDVDGTLAPIAPRPEDAVVPTETRRVIAALSARTGVEVALVSGRAAADARRMVAVSDSWVVGNHGAEVVSPTGEETVDPLVAPYETAIAEARQELAMLMEPVAGVTVEDKRLTLSVHYRQADPQVAPHVQATVERVAHARGLRVHEGKKVYEVRPPVRVDKGTAVFALGQRLGGTAPDATLLFAGDDRTDEDAFRMLRDRAPHAVTVRVADDPSIETVAEFVVGSTEEIRELLELLLELVPTT